MASPETAAQIEAQARLRQLTSRAAVTAWEGLPNTDEESVAGFLAKVVPLILAAQRQSIALSDAYMARLLGRRPIGINPQAVIASLRNGVAPETVYRRPFVQVWSSLSNGVPYTEAVSAAGSRIDATAQMDVQLAQRGGLQAVQDSDPNIYGFARTADPDACAFCQVVDGAYVKRADAMALHDRCGCSLTPLIGAHKRAAKLPDGTPIADLLPQGDVDSVAINAHGEVGPVLGDPAHHFTTL